MNKNDRPTDIGINRTGIALSPVDGPLMTEGATARPPSSAGSARDAAILRFRYAVESGEIGHMPPPLSLRGVTQAAVELIKGHKGNVLLDKLGERLAFERTGVRLFDGLILKFEASGSWAGGPTLEDLVSFRADEARHFEWMVEAMTALGADATAMTPSADLTAVESLGVLQVISDPRTGLAQALHAQQIAELADVAGWELLAALAESLGHAELAAQCRLGLAQEHLHAASVARWLRAHVEAAAHGELARAS
ncbi:ferritin-like domain-containing protein [Nannocystis punicea]|uniref:Ferritin-like domain-containing protein n=1 Tax=Nannocystis punicea TaxID=2995304 RepID=A0ABY7HB97_9BACT|nr:ferritin-like domain-containing protein [Nannocystis poenicansa]WAS96546.1 ferritin-like domain-containing protein [Nannocystis poenicansa]